MSYSGKKKRSIVTGGLGLIGSYLSDVLIEMGQDVTIVDNMYRGKIEYLKYPEKVNLIKKDVMDLDESDVVNGAETVFHLASRVLGIGYSFKNHQEMMFYNDKMTNSLFDYLDMHLDALRHLVVISSSCVYDDNLEVTSEDLGNEGLPEMANLGYGLAKRFLEQKSILWAKENNIKLTIVRPFNIYGERYTWAGEFSQGLPSLVKKILDNNGRIEIWGTGNQRRNYLHAYDCAKLILDISRLSGEHIGVFNIGVKETISLRELAEKMCLLYGVKPDFTFREDMPEGRLEKSSDESRLCSLVPNFKNDLISIEEGLLHMKEWYLENFN